MVTIRLAALSSWHYIARASLLVVGAILLNGVSLALASEPDVSFVLALTPEDEEVLGPDTVVQIASRALQHASSLTNPKLASIYLTRGRAQLQHSDVRSALNDFESAVGLQPNDPYGRCFRAHAWMFTGREDDAEVELLRLAGETEGRAAARACESLGVMHLNRGEFQLALLPLSKAISLAPQQVSAFHERAVVHLQLGNLRECIGDINRALALHPGFRGESDVTSPFYLRGRAHLGLGNARGAIRDLLVALQVNPKSSPSRYELYRAYAHLGKHSLALWLALEMLRGQWDDPRARTILREAATNAGVEDIKNALETGSTAHVPLNCDLEDLETLKVFPVERVIDDLCRALGENDGERATLLRKRAAAYQKLGTLVLAEQDLRMARQLQPDDIDIRYRLAHLLSEIPSGQIDADRELGELLQMDPNYAPAYTLQAYRRLGAHDYGAAMKSVEEGLRLAPEDSWGRAVRGCIKCRQRDFVGALADLDAALSNDPFVEKANGYIVRGIALLETGNYSSALRNFLFARLLEPSSVHAYRFICLTYAKQRKEEMALLAIQQMEQKFPNDGGARRTAAQVRASFNR